jgi:benzoylformate decarboxylase
VLSNGGYAVMDRLAEQRGEARPWPSFSVDICSLAQALGCPAARIDDHPGLVRVLDEALPDLAGRSEPLLLEVVVSPGTTFRP